MHRSLTLLASLALSATLHAAGPDPTIRVPSATRMPVIDGTIEPKEWKGATRVPLTENLGHALLTHDENYLYVALVGNKPGIGSVCVKGKTGVRVLHASAALGTAAFEQEKGKWQVTRGFSWTNRDTGTSEAAMAERKQMLSTSGWFANTSRTAATGREYQIPIRGQNDLSIVLGFFTFTPEEQRFLTWPAALEDSCGDPDLAGGFTDGQYEFDPTRWGVLELD